MSLRLEKYHLVAIAGWISKIITIIFSLINTRLLIELIGIKGFAVYSILFSMIGWLTLLNFGIPNTIQNLISKYKIKRINLKDVFESITFIVIFIIVIGLIVVPIISLIIYEFMLTKYQDVIYFQSVLLIFFILFFSGVSEIFNKILFALHKGYIPNLYPAVISILAFSILLLAKKLNINDVNVILILFFLPYLFIFVVAYLQSIGFTLPRYNRGILIEIFHISKKFFLFAVLAAMVLRVDYLIMSRILSSEDIAAYNLDMRVFNLVLFFYGTILLALWPVCADYFNSNRKELISKLIKKNIAIGITVTLSLTLLIVIFKDKIFYLLSGKENLVISYSTLILTGFYILIRVWTDTFATVLQSMNEVDILIYSVPFQATISITGQYVLGEIFGLNGIILGLILSFILTVCWILPLKFYKVVREEKNER